jgi:hypothetical protein
MTRRGQGPPAPPSARRWNAALDLAGTYDARLSLDVDRGIADNFVYSPGLGKHRHMA